MCAIGRDEVDDRGLVLQMAGKIHPAFIGLEQDILIGGIIELRTGRIQRRYACVAAAGQVDGGKIERQAEQVVAQRTGDELVDFVACLTCHAADDSAGRDIRIDGRRAAIILELQRIEEAFDQPDMVRVEVRVEAIDRLGQHRVTEAVDHMRELGDDRRIDRHVEAVGNQEYVDVRLDLAGEFFEHEMLVLHLGAELGGLEKALTIPDKTCRTGRNSTDVVNQPFVQEGHGFGLRRTAVQHRNGICEHHFLSVLD